MSIRNTHTAVKRRFSIKDLSGDIRRVSPCSEIVKGLSAKKKSIPSVYFYDKAGSSLFEEITRLDEYYIPRTEKKLITEAAREMSGKRRKRDIIEIGSGDCSKISIILEAIPPADRPTVTYVPVDVSRSAIKDSAYKLLERFPSLRIAGVLADFRTQLHRITSSREKLFCFFGSTIGNLSGSEAVSCLREIRKAMRRGDALLLGIDMVKPREVLERAYNDSRGITAEFNRNILKVSNRLAGTDFDPADFDHVAFYNSELGRIEMHLRACKRTKVSCPFAGEDITLKDGETIHTENSRKFTGPGVDELLEGAGLMRKRTYGDPDGWFSLIEVVRK